MIRAWQQLATGITHWLEVIVHGWPKPPCNFNICAPVGLESSGNSFDLKSIINNGILWGVPVHKTSRPRKMMRRYNVYKIWRPLKNLVMCQHCGSWHQLHTICGECYKTVKAETDEMKKVYVGGSMETETLVVYQNEQEKCKDEFGTLQCKVEMGKPRPQWFSNDLKKRWFGLSGNSRKTD